MPSTKLDQALSADVFNVTAPYVDAAGTVWFGRGGAAAWAIYQVLAGSTSEASWSVVGSSHANVRFVASDAAYLYGSSSDVSGWVGSQVIRVSRSTRVIERWSAVPKKNLSPLSVDGTRFYYHDGSIWSVPLVDLAATPTLLGTPTDTVSPAPDGFVWREPAKAGIRLLRKTGVLDVVATGTCEPLAVRATATHYFFVVGSELDPLGHDVWQLPR